MDAAQVNTSLDEARRNVDDTIDEIERNPGQCVNFTWLVTLIFIAVDVCVAIATAAQNSGSQGSNEAVFAAVWVLLMLLFVAVLGTVTLKKYHTPLSVGVFLGMTSMMSQLMFVLFAVFIALGNDAEGDDASGDRAMAAFCFILFFLFFFFSVILARYRTTVIIKANEASSDRFGGWNAAPETEAPAEEEQRPAEGTSGTDV